MQIATIFVCLLSAVFASSDDDKAADRHYRPSCCPQVQCCRPEVTLRPTFGVPIKALQQATGTLVAGGVTSTLTLTTPFDFVPTVAIWYNNASLNSASPQFPITGASSTVISWPSASTNSSPVNTPTYLVGAQLDFGTFLLKAQESCATYSAYRGAKCSAYSTSVANADVLTVFPAYLDAAAGSPYANLFAASGSAGCFVANYNGVLSVIQSNLAVTGVIDSQYANCPLACSF